MRCKPCDRNTPLRSGGRGRNRTIDTRIFSTTEREVRREQAEEARGVSAPRPNRPHRPSLYRALRERTDRARRRAHALQRVASIATRTAHRPLNVSGALGGGDAAHAGGIDPGDRERRGMGHATGATECSRTASCVVAFVRAPTKRVIRTILTHGLYPTPSRVGQFNSKDPPDSICIPTRSELVLESQ